MPTPTGEHDDAQRVLAGAHGVHGAVFTAMVPVRPRGASAQRGNRALRMQLAARAVNMQRAERFLPSYLVSLSYPARIPILPCPYPYLTLPLSQITSPLSTFLSLTAVITIGG